MSDHEEVPHEDSIDSARLARIRQRALRLRNWIGTYNPDVPCSCGTSFCRKHGETPTISSSTDGNGNPQLELHVGCGDLCPVMLIVPFDEESHSVDTALAQAACHLGLDALHLCDALEEALRTVSALSQELKSR